MTALPLISTTYETTSMLGNMMVPQRSKSFSPLTVIGLRIPLFRRFLTQNDCENNLPKSFAMSEDQYLFFSRFSENVYSHHS